MEQQAQLRDGIHLASVIYDLYFQLMFHLDLFMRPLHSDSLFVAYYKIFFCEKSIHLLWAFKNEISPLKVMYVRTVCCLTI